MTATPASVTADACLAQSDTKSGAGQYVTPGALA
jgi:hypothetical protein